MNRCLTNLCRIEFPVTYRCNGRCIHCSEAGRRGISAHIDGDIAAKAIKRVASEYKITSVMTFGGEPLLYPEDVYKIHSAARDCCVASREIITNGCFSRDCAVLRSTARRLAESGCNRVLLSVDAFHQNTLPIEPVKIFAEELLGISGVTVKTNPAWISGRGADNPYDAVTEKLVSEFEKMGVTSAKGNVIFPAGNAKKYLAEYFDPEKEYINPYEQDPHDVKSISIGPDGGIFGGNIYRTDIIKILDGYTGE